MKIQRRAENTMEVGVKEPKIVKVDVTLWFVLPP